MARSCVILCDTFLAPTRAWDVSGVALRNERASSSSCKITPRHEPYAKSVFQSAPACAVAKKAPHDALPYPQRSAHVGAEVRSRGDPHRRCGPHIAAGGADASLGAKRVPARVANARADDSMGPPNSYRAATGH